MNSHQTINARILNLFDKKLIKSSCVEIYVWTKHSFFCIFFVYLFFTLVLQSEFDLSSAIKFFLVIYFAQNVGNNILRKRTSSLLLKMFNFTFIFFSFNSLEEKTNIIVSVLISLIYNRIFFRNFSAQFNDSYKSHMQSFFQRLSLDNLNFVTRSLYLVYFLIVRWFLFQSLMFFLFMLFYKSYPIAFLFFPILSIFFELFILALLSSLLLFLIGDFFFFHFFSSYKIIIGDFLLVVHNFFIFSPIFQYNITRLNLRIMFLWILCFLFFMNEYRRLKKTVFDTSN